MNKELLKKKMMEVKADDEALARAAGLSREAWARRLDGRVEFTLKDIVAVVKFLELSRREAGEIFFDV